MDRPPGPNAESTATGGAGGGAGPVLVFGDSLTFHGPDGPHAPSDPRLWPTVMSAALGRQVDLVARIGWTSRDVWWALTKDASVWGTFLPRASAVVLAAGGMDTLPAVIPTYLREGIAYLRPGGLRRRVRRAYLASAPRLIEWSGGPIRQLPQRATDAYMTRTVEAIRAFYPELPILALSPSPYDSAYYPSQRYHRSARRAAFAWAERNRVVAVDIEAAIQEGLDAGEGNPDGLHWSWRSHRLVGGLVAAAIERTAAR